MLPSPTLPSPTLPCHPARRCHRSIWIETNGSLAFVIERRKEVDALRAELPVALKRCVDPARFVMDAVSEVFPVDRHVVRSPADLAWACVLILEAVVPTLADPDPEIGAARPVVPKASRERVRGMAAEWKEAAERKGTKPPDTHAFLQHVATFAVAEKKDGEVYRRIVLSFSWRRQMSRLALTLVLEDEMEGYASQNSLDRMLDDMDKCLQWCQQRRGLDLLLQLHPPHQHEVRCAISMGDAQEPQTMEFLACKQERNQDIALAFLMRKCCSFTFTGAFG